MSASSKSSPRKASASKPAGNNRTADAAYKAKRADLTARLKTLRDESEALAISAGELLTRIRS